MRASLVSRNHGRGQSVAVQARSLARLSVRRRAWDVDQLAWPSTIGKFWDNPALCVVGSRATGPR